MIGFVVAFKSWEDHRKQNELEETCKVDESGKHINPRIPRYMSIAPWCVKSESEKHVSFSFPLSNLLFVYRHMPYCFKCCNILLLFCLPEFKTPEEVEIGSKSHQAMA